MAVEHWKKRPTTRRERPDKVTHSEDGVDLRFIR